MSNWFDYCVNFPLRDMLRQTLLSMPTEVQWMFAMCAVLVFVWLCTRVIERFSKGIE